MIFRTLLFFVLMYFLVKFISRLFLPTKSKNRNRKGASFFYNTFQQFQQQQQKQQQQQQQNRHRRQSNNNSDHFSEIEEAEFEDVTDEEKTGTE